MPTTYSCRPIRRDCGPAAGKWTYRDGYVDALEESLFDDHSPDHDLQRKTFELRKNLVRLRRVVLPMREVLNTLLRRDDLVGCSSAVQPFL